MKNNHKTMDTYILSQHIAVVPGRGQGFWVCNPYTGTKLYTSKYFWELAKLHQTPRAATTALARESVHKSILVKPGTILPSKAHYTIIKAISRYLNAHHIKTTASLKPEIWPSLLDKTKSLLYSKLSSTFPSLSEWRNFAWDTPEGAFQAIFSQLQHFFTAELRPIPYDTIPVDLLQKSMGRPLPKLEYEQQPCDLWTTYQRTLLLKQNHRRGTQILLLGDDDLISLAAGGYFQVDLIEIDQTLIDFLKPRVHPSVSVQVWNILQGLPHKFHNRYEAVISDPTYAEDNLTGFLTSCHTALKSTLTKQINTDPPTSSYTPQSTTPPTIYLSTCPELLENKSKFFQTIRSLNLRIVKHIPYFNRYPMPETARTGGRIALKRLHFPPYLIKAFLSIPYLYADMFLLQPTYD